MSRIDFMNELESLLSDIPIEERKEALQYYNDYFEDAGADHEEEIMKELVSPQRIASIIKAELSANSEDTENRGFFTEKGYQDTIYKDEKFELVGASAKEAGNQGSTDNNGSTGNKQNQWNGTGTYQNSQQQGSGFRNDQQKKQSKNTNIGLIIVLCIFAIPVGLPLICTFFGVALGIAGAILGIIVGFGAAGIAMMVAGIALVIAGIIQIGAPLVGLLLCGAGLLVLGLGMLFTLATALICKKVIPALVRGFVNICRLPFRNRSVTA